MKNMILLVCLAVILGLIPGGCATGISTMKNNYPSVLQKEWKHSYEESASGIEVYRPADYKAFAPGMFRQVYNFKAGGACEYLVLHPADAHYMTKGTWNYNPQTHYIQIRNEKGEQVVLFEVLDIGKNIMKIRSVP